jgi:hypothetical protein
VAFNRGEHLFAYNSHIHNCCLLTVEAEKVAGVGDALQPNRTPFTGKNLNDFTV